MVFEIFFMEGLLVNHLLHTGQSLDPTWAAGREVTQNVGGTLLTSVPVRQDSGQVFFHMSYDQTFEVIFVATILPFGTWETWRETG